MGFLVNMVYINGCLVVLVGFVPMVFVWFIIGMYIFWAIAQTKGLLHWLPAANPCRAGLVGRSTES